MLSIIKCLPALGIFLCHLFSVYVLRYVFSFSSVMSMIIANMLFCVLCIFYFVSKRYSSVLEFDEQPQEQRVIKRYLPDYLAIIVYFLLFLIIYFYTQGISFWTLYFTGDVQYKHYNVALLKEQQSVLFLTLIAAPLYEELFVRGVLYDSLKQSMNHVYAFLLQAVCFALMHGTLVHLWLSFLFSLFLAFIYERFGSIKYCVFFHFVFNLCTYVFGTGFVQFLGSLEIIVIVNVGLCLLLCALYSNLMKEGILCEEAKDEKEF